MKTSTEHITVVLLEDLPSKGLRKGDVGAVVLLHSDSVVEVEFVNKDGTAKSVTAVPKRLLIELNLDLITTG